MKLAYIAFDRQGKSSTGTIEAAGEAEAREQLRRRGLFVTELGNPATVAASNPSGAAGRLGAGARLRNLAMFSRQLHALIASGTQIVPALSAIERQCETDAWANVVADVRRRVEEGAPLSEAMRNHPESFDAVSRSLVAAGESSGNLPEMLDRMAILARKQLHLRSCVIGAMVYPCLLVTIGIVVLIVMIMFVLPRFSGLFESLDSPLPPTTKMLLWLSEVLWSWWWAILMGIAGAGVGGWYWATSDAGRRLLHERILQVPRLGKLVRSLISARLSRMLGTLLESRVTLIEALQLTRQSAMHVQYIELLRRAEDAVGRGEPVSSVLGDTPLISACVQEALRNGESTGRIGEPLVQMADFLDEENDVIIKSLTSILEPLILVVLGVIVGFIALSMFLPLFDLVASANRG